MLPFNWAARFRALPNGCPIASSLLALWRLRRQLAARRPPLPPTALLGVLRESTKIAAPAAKSYHLVATIFALTRRRDPYWQPHRAGRPATMATVEQYRTIQERVGCRQFRIPGSELRRRLSQHSLSLSHSPATTQPMAASQTGELAAFRRGRQMAAQDPSPKMFAS